jgi:hypothetical protein
MNPPNRRNLGLTPPVCGQPLGFVADPVANPLHGQLRYGQGVELRDETGLVRQISVIGWKNLKKWNLRAAVNAESSTEIEFGLCEGWHSSPLAFLAGLFNFQFPGGAK